MKHEQWQAECVLDLGAQLGECPVWLAQRQELLFVDILNGTVHRYDPRTGGLESRGLGQHVGAVIPRSGGGYVVAARDGIGFWDWDGSLSFVNPIEAELTGNRFNDAKCDPAGRLWAGTMAYDFTPGAGNLYAVSADMEWERRLAGLTISNGLAWNSDHSRMYFIDSGTQRVDVFDFDVANGTFANHRTFCEVDPEDGLPDGMTIDAQDCLWVAVFGSGAVRRYDPAGTWIGTVRTSAPQVTSCCFGGPDLEDLYITSAAMKLSDDAPTPPTAGALFRCKPGVRGTPTVEFSG